jgi:hypothetical protein
MTNWHLSTPVAFLIFNRPGTTARVFDAIRQASPPKLLIVADGPRQDRQEDVEQCAAARSIVEQVDWPCEVLRNYSDVNLGCRRRVSSGLDWVFTMVPEAIVLEDDCLPEPSFFRFCEELLDRYRNDERVMMISGDNFQFGRRRTSHSYYFTRYTHIWGWATWRRAWQHYDVSMRQWQEIRDGGWLGDILDDAASVRHWKGIFDRVARGEINTWDYQWAFACWLQSGLAVMPNVNLVSNIGFNAGATHTGENSPFSAMPTAPVPFPLSHPGFVVRDKTADAYTQNTHVTTSIQTRIRRKLKNLLFPGKP